MVGIALLNLARFSLYIAAIVLAVIEFIVDAVALAALNNFGLSSGPVGAAGWTMFVTIISLLILPILAFGNVLTRKNIKFVHLFNRILYELIIVGTLCLFLFISGIVMANYAGSGGCFGISVCSKFKAATAFPWLSFFVLLVLSVVLTLMLLKVRKSGGDIKAALSYEIQDEYPAVAAAPPQTASEPYPAAVQGGNIRYYDSHPDVSMPVPREEV
ncbi:hypothetical protein BX661DRAFT_182862 [Kickxella alabastrina]|uniref:uncharacterized protein n=1 Tax=Kickxella alabastrina TaxID=61397 RepID=UPI00221FF8CA|nr:uncharacterized protein BX661DRAFT_182862 [Kickxella alabastrina]KAI7827205.1 hypothetical protein BX661DRAFT_182862 [Kickxella alabastrina]